MVLSVNIIRRNFACIVNDRFLFICVLIINTDSRYFVLKLLISFYSKPSNLGGRKVVHLIYKS